jgi:D-serine dehydratase
MSNHHHDVATTHRPRLNKGIGPWGAPDRPVSDWGWNILQETVSLPMATLSQDCIAHNLAWMQGFIDAYGLKLAPHGKTTMCPALFRRQMAAGAWGMTFATVQQVQVAWQHGLRRCILANQLVGRAHLMQVSQWLRDPGFELFVLVDDPGNVHTLGAFFAEQGQCLNVLLELGVHGGRSGVRDEAQEAAVLQALARWPQALALRGLELYEGVLKDEAHIRAFLHRAVERLHLWQKRGHMATERAVLTGAGSAWFDVVAECWQGLELGRPLDVVLRPGCYLTHDVGIYREAQDRILQNNPVARTMLTGLRPALKLWAYVQSRPEPGLAIVGLGKRDAAFDAGLPVPVLRYRPGHAAPEACAAHWKLVKMMDQHAYLELQPDDDVAVGDILAFDISHPCLTFDKWRQLAVIDERYSVVELLETFF